MLGRMTQQELLVRGGSALAPDVLVREQNPKPLGSLGVAACRV